MNSERDRLKHLLIILLEEISGAPVGILSVGPRRASTLFRSRDA